MMDNANGTGMIMPVAGGSCCCLSFSADGTTVDTVLAQVAQVAFIRG